MVGTNPNVTYLPTKIKNST